MVLKLNGADVLSLDVSPERVAFASDLGIKASLLKDFPADRKAEFCIDCTGHAKGLTIAMDHLYPRGTLILKTTVATPDLLDLNQIVINEFRIQGSRCGPFAPALRLLSSGLVDPRPLITARVPFHEVIRALEVAGNPENMKVIIDHT
jgi:threonine dehydrogenase-like Zn-dependent dehydrogenase